MRDCCPLPILPPCLACLPPMDSKPHFAGGLVLLGTDRDSHRHRASISAENVD